MWVHPHLDPSPSGLAGYLGKWDGSSWVEGPQRTHGPTAPRGAARNWGSLAAEAGMQRQGQEHGLTSPSQAAD